MLSQGKKSSCLFGIDRISSGPLNLLDRSVFHFVWQNLEKILQENLKNISTIKTSNFKGNSEGKPKTSHLFCGATSLTWHCVKMEGQDRVGQGTERTAPSRISATRLSGYFTTWQQFLSVNSALIMQIYYHPNTFLCT